MAVVAVAAAPEPAAAVGAAPAAAATAATATPASSKPSSKAGSRRGSVSKAGSAAVAEATSTASSNNTASTTTTPTTVVGEPAAAAVAVAPVIPGMVAEAHPYAVRALYSHTGTIPEQLSFRRGEVLLIDAAMEGWLSANVLNDPTRRGWIPSNYVERLPEGAVLIPAANATNDKSNNSNSNNKSKSRRGSAVAPVVVVANGDPAASSTSSSTASTPAATAAAATATVPAPTTVVAKVEPPHTPGPNTGHMAASHHAPACDAAGASSSVAAGQAQVWLEALFDYSAEFPDLQLSFQKGDVFRLVSKEDPDWWDVRPQDNPTAMGAVPALYMRQLIITAPTVTTTATATAATPAATASVVAAPAVVEVAAAEQEKEKDVPVQESEKASSDAHPKANGGRHSRAPSIVALAIAAVEETARRNSASSSSSSSSSAASAAAAASDHKTPSRRGSLKPVDVAGSTPPTRSPAVSVSAAAAAAAPVAVVAAATPAAAVAGSGATHRAAFPFTASADGQLSYGFGDLLRLVSKDHEGWWTFVHVASGAQGMVAANYVSELSAEETAAMAPAPAQDAAVEPVAGVAAPVAAVVAEKAPSRRGSSFKAPTAAAAAAAAGTSTPTTRRSPAVSVSSASAPVVAVAAAAATELAVASEPAATSAPSVAAAPAAAPAAGAVSVGGATHRAAFPFVASVEGQLSFAFGELLALVSKEHEAWWRFSLLSTGAQGLVASNYVVELTEDEKKAAIAAAVRNFASSSAASPWIVEAAWRRC